MSIFLSVWDTFEYYYNIPVIRKVKLATLVEDDPKSLWGVGEGAIPFPGFLHFTFDPYLIVLSAKQAGIKYHFLSLWYDSNWDWTLVS